MRASSTTATALQCICLCVSFIVAATSCTQPVPPEGPTAEAVPNEDLDALWQTSLSVLRKHDLQPDRQDLAGGIISTFPTTSQHWVEFWRQDVADLYSFAQASIHTIRRRATIRFTKEPDGWVLGVQIDTERLATPEYQVTSASSAIQSFSGALPTATGELSRDPSVIRDWTALGRDPAFEARLLNQILSEAGRLAVPTVE